MSRAFRAVVVVLGVSVVATAATAGDGKSGAKVSSKDALERLKGLAGEWKVEGGHGGQPGKIVYRVVSNGSTVMENLFPGTGHEMISMYHLDGDDLKMTHYCALGNQPRMKLDRAASTPDRLVFVFDGGTNLDPANDMHIHAGQIAFKGKDRVEAGWEAYAKGKSAGLTTFELTRP